MASCLGMISCCPGLFFFFLFLFFHISPTAGYFLSFFLIITIHLYIFAYAPPSWRTWQGSENNPDRWWPFVFLFLSFLLLLSPSLLWREFPGLFVTLPLPPLSPSPVSCCNPLHSMSCLLVFFNMGLQASLELQWKQALFLGGQVLLRLWDLIPSSQFPACIRHRVLLTSISFRVPILEREAEFD